MSVRFDSPWCGAGCLTLAEWDGLADHPQFREALAIAYQHNPEWRSYAQRAVVRGTTITTKPLVGALGAYNRRDDVISIRESLLDEGLDVVAAVLTHEVVHVSAATPSLTREGVADCLEEEMRAHAMEAATWAAVRQPARTSPTRNGLDSLVRAWERQRIRDLVILSAPRHRQCFTRELPNY